MIGEISVIHQKEVQKRGGVCVRYPVSCLIKELLCKGSVECGPDYRLLWILDLTFGEGRFWKALDGLLRPFIWGFDVRKLRWHVRPNEFVRKPAWAWKYHIEVRNFHFKLVVADPPWSPYHRENDRRKHYNMHYMVGQPEDILKTGLEAAKHFQAPLLIHYKDRWVPEGTRVLAETWFQGWSRLSKMPKPTWFGILEVIK